MVNTVFDNGKQHFQEQSQYLGLFSQPLGTTRKHVF
mgnify:CR=1 FL=1